MKVLGWAARVVGVVVAMGAAWGLFLADRAWQFRSLEETALDCTQVEGVTGPEDLTVHRDHALAFVSAYDRRAAPGEEGGGIWAYDLKPSRQDAPLLRKLTDEFEGSLRPHGISLRRSAIDGDVLFVVNHPEGGGHAVEVFDWRRPRLVHRTTVTDPLLVSPNDVVAVGTDRFYATNDHGTSAPRGQLLDDVLLRRRASVVYWDGAEMRVVADGLAYANGINVSKDGKLVWIASTTTGEVHTYDRDPETGDLSHWHTESLGTGVDNIEVDLHGSLWIAAHPKLLQFMRHARDAEKISASEVLWYDSEKRLDPYVRPVYLDLGEEISGVSVAAPFGSRVLMGSVFEPFLLVCERG